MSGLAVQCSDQSKGSRSEKDAFCVHCGSVYALRVVTPGTYECMDGCLREEDGWSDAFWPPL